MTPLMNLSTSRSGPAHNTTVPSFTYGLYDGKLSLQLPHDGGRLSLYDGLGRVVTASALTGNTLSLNVDHYAPGIYFINYLAGDRSYTQKVFIK
jgi:hypothetical protein